MIASQHKMSEAIIAEARRWLGTPYVHQASVCGQGADCLGLIRGVWRKVIGSEPQHLPSYTKDWGEVSKNETMLEAANMWFQPIENHNAEAADLILFRWKNVSIIKHAGILTANGQFIHAYEKTGVVETTLGSSWKSRIAATFRFPNCKTYG